jgi:hypothetical protein
MTQALPFAWYDTPHIRYFTVADFRAECRKRGWRIQKERFASQNGGGRPRGVGVLPNLRSSLALFLLDRPGGGGKASPP